MEQLTQTITSNEVADMIGKEHSKLIRDIRTYIGYLGEAKIGSSDFFIESTYKSEQNKDLPNYLLTKQGCELVSNKLTGAKGVQFTAKYVSRFNQMEEHIKKQLDTSNLSPELQFMNSVVQSLAKQEQETKRIEAKVDNITEIVALNSMDWRKDSRTLINKMARTQGGFEAYREVQADIYQELDRRAGSSLRIRVTNKRRRMADEGASKSKRDKLSKLDVISEDKRLLEIYLAIVKEYAVKYGVWDNEF